MAEVDIGMGKSARVGYGLEDLVIVPSRRTRDPEDVDISWQLEAFRFALPMMASPMDGIVSPTTAALVDKLGGLAVLDLEGLWTRYEDPTPLLVEIANSSPGEVTARLQMLYSAPIQRTLVIERLAEIAAAGAVTCGAITPQRAVELGPAVLEAEIDILVIRNTVVSAEHVSKGGEPLNLKSFIRELDVPVVVGGCASYQAALHLMRTGAIGVLVGVGAGSTSVTRPVLGIGTLQATAISDAAGARTRHLEETGVYVQIVADGAMTTGGDIAKAIACGADAVMLDAPLAANEAPADGALFDATSAHPRLPRGRRGEHLAIGSLESILLGPSTSDDGRSNLIGALRTTMAFCGYANLREFHKAEVLVAAAGGLAPRVEH